MKNLKRFVLAVVAVLFFTGVAAADHHAVKIAEKEGVGKYLTDATGMTLYWFKKDSPGKSGCSGACLEKWPAYYRETVGLTGGLTAGDFGTITRDDGTKQTTFRGFPLYYWVGDKKAGDTTGHGVKDVWFIVNPDAFPVK